MQDDERGALVGAVVKSHVVVAAVRVRLDVEILQSSCSTDYKNRWKGFCGRFRTKFCLLISGVLFCNCSSRVVREAEHPDQSQQSVVPNHLHGRTKIFMNPKVQIWWNLERELNDVVAVDLDEPVAVIRVIVHLGIIWRVDFARLCRHSASATCSGQENHKCFLGMFTT